MLFKLHPAISGNVVIPVTMTRPTGGYIKRRITIVPNEEYDAEDDKQLIASMRQARQLVMYSAATEQWLKDSGISYETEMCRSCGGSTRKLKYNPIVEIE